MKKPRILVNLFHPEIENSRGNKALSENVKELDNVTYRNLYKEYPNFKIDVEREQQLLLDHDLIVFQHPFYWYSAPSLLKEWECQVLEADFAYPPGVGDKLQGKDWLSVVTVGGPETAYSSGAPGHYSMDELLRPFQSTASFCSMSWLEPLLFYGVLTLEVEGFTNISDEDLATHAQKYRGFLENYSLDA